MIIGGNNIPSHEERHESLQYKKQQEFYSWLRKVPFGILREAYRNAYLRRNPLDKNTSTQAIESVASNITQSNFAATSVPEKVVLRRSVFLLIINLISIEIFFDLIYIGLKFPSIYFSFSPALQNQLMPAYFVCFVLLNIMKVIIMLIAALGWVTNRYHIGRGEIRYKSGILKHSEKIFLCNHTQQVTFEQGFWGRLFNFGSIEIYNPALKEKIYLDSVPDPSKCADIVKKNLSNSSGTEYFLLQE